MTETEKAQERWNDFLQAEPQTEVKKKILDLNLEIIHFNRHNTNAEINKTTIEFKNDEREHYGNALNVFNYQGQRRIEVSTELNEILESNHISIEEIESIADEFSQHKYIYGAKAFKTCVREGQTDFDGYTIEKLQSKKLKIKGLSFVGATFKEIGLVEPIIENCDFTNATIKEGMFKNGTINSTFDKADLSSTQFRNCNLSNSSFIEANLNYTKVYESNLTNANLSNAKKITRFTGQNTNFTNVTANGLPLEDLAEIRSFQVQKIAFMKDTDFEVKMVKIDETDPYFNMLEMSLADAGLPSNHFLVIKNGENHYIEALQFNEPIKKGTYSAGEGQIDLAELVIERFESDEHNELNKDFKELGIVATGVEMNNNNVITTYALHRDPSKTFSISLDQTHNPFDSELVITNQETYEQFLEQAGIKGNLRDSFERDLMCHSAELHKEDVENNRIENRLDRLGVKFGQAVVLDDTLISSFKLTKNPHRKIEVKTDINNSGKSKIPNSGLIKELVEDLVSSKDEKKALTKKLKETLINASNEHYKENSDVIERRTRDPKIALHEQQHLKSKNQRRKLS